MPNSPDDLPLPDFGYACMDLPVSVWICRKRERSKGEEDTSRHCSLELGRMPALENRIRTEPGRAGTKRSLQESGDENAQGPSEGRQPTASAQEQRGCSNCWALQLGH